MSAAAELVRDPLPERSPRPARGSAASLPLRPGEVVRRGLNVSVAAVALLLAAPGMLIIAIAIKLTSPGPVFFTQTRGGINRRRLLPIGTRYRLTDRGGRPFMIYKFRTMTQSGGGPSTERWATPADPRVPPLGRVLRLELLAQLPQVVHRPPRRLARSRPAPEK